MKKNIKILVAAAAIVFIVWNLVSFLIGRTTSEMVQYGTLEDSFGATLYLFKDEVVIDGAGDGVLRPTVADGERVSKGARIGAVLSADTDEGALHEYLRIQDRIQNLKSRRSDAGYTETIRTDEQITALSRQITAAAEHGNMEKVTTLKDALLIAKDEKSAASGEKENLIGLLEERRRVLEAGIGNSVKEIYSPEAGTLLLQTDGLEEIMSVEKAEGMTPARLAEITQSIGSYGGCKVLYNTVWKGACTVSAEKAATLNAGQAVTLRFHDCGGVTEKAKIAEISAEEDGQCVVVVSSNRTPAGLMQCRKVTADIIISRYEGLRVPREAIAEKDGKQGVYVQTITEQVFRTVEVAFAGEEYAIIREGENTTLRLYDTVVY